MQQSSYEGRQDHIPNLQTPHIEVFSNVYKNNSYTIEFTIPEFTAICPKTGLPDFGTIFVSYQPDEFCLELKSLKEYILFFRDQGIFHENVVNKICDDLFQASAPNFIQVIGDFNIRGGIKTRVKREKKK